MDVPFTLVFTVNNTGADDKARLLDVPFSVRRMRAEVVLQGALGNLVAGTSLPTRSRNLVSGDSSPVPGADLVRGTLTVDGRAWHSESVSISKIAAVDPDQDDILADPFQLKAGSSVKLDISTNGTGVNVTTRLYMIGVKHYPD